MTGSTKDRLVAAAAHLLDHGGQDAVTLRAVANQVGVSHNAPYKHFRDREALLARVAKQDFDSLTLAFLNARDRQETGIAALRAALGAFVVYAEQHRARYRLLFSGPKLLPDEELKTSSTEPLRIFVEIVELCQKQKSLPAVDATRLAGLFYATVHGAIDLEIGGRGGSEKGLESVSDVVDFVICLIGN